MSELNEQIHIEDDTLDMEPGEKRPAVHLFRCRLVVGCGNQPRLGCSQVTNVTATEAFQHYASLYIKYLQIFRKLETAYDNMLHPQKRIDVKTILELVQARVLELKHALVRWAPRNPDVNPPGTKLPPFPFPWEYVNLDDIMVDLKLPPALLEVPVPRYYTEDRQDELKNRNKVARFP
jgi:IQ and AAA domain-containing protein